MKRLFCLFSLLLTIWHLSAQRITAAEYFFDIDPGAGKGSPITIGAPAPSVVFTTNIATNSLGAGFHSLAVRAKDENGNWGPLESRTVYVSAVQPNVTPIVAAEYYFDNDPGVGKGTGLSIGTPGNTVQISAVLPTTSLQPGFHTLAIRTRNAEGHWSLLEASGFYLSSQPVMVQPITAVEYYIDNDPGVGLGTPVSIGTSSHKVNFVATLPTTSLSSGFHRLAVRAKTADGAWSNVETRGFYIQPVSTTMGAITQAEYFLDSDPGVGNAVPLAITSPGNSVSQNFLITIPPHTPDGQHLLAIRVQDASGHWGLIEWKEITVNSVSLPLDWVSFTGRRKENTIALQWATENENNTSHFDVERSVNGFDFGRIGQTTASGGVQNNYHYTDASPVNGVNFYRLRQVDRNGAFKYSAIVKVYFSDAESNNLKLFPQPVNNELKIVFSGKGKEVLVQVYDAAGKLVINERKQNNLPIHLTANNLAKGTYWIVISDGITQQQGKFIKQ